MKNLAFYLSVICASAGYTLLFITGGWKLALGVMLVDLASFFYERSGRNQV